MAHAKLLRLAENEVKRTMARLPVAVREAAEECMTVYDNMEESMQEDQSLTDDLLGLFEGYSRMDPLPAGPADMPRIRLFLDNLWDYAEGEERRFRREVRITWLHELGHYLGWGEEEVEALGLE